MSTNLPRTQQELQWQQEQLQATDEAIRELFGNVDDLENPILQFGNNLSFPPTAPPVTLPPPSLSQPPKPRKKPSSKPKRFQQTSLKFLDSNSQPIIPQTNSNSDLQLVATLSIQEVAAFCHDWFFTHNIHPQHPKYFLFHRTLYLTVKKKFDSNSPVTPLYLNNLLNSFKF